MNNSGYSVVYPVVNGYKIKFELQLALTLHKRKLNYNSQSSISTNNIMSVKLSSQKNLALMQLSSRIHLTKKNTAESFGLGGWSRKDIERYKGKTWEL